MSTGSHLVGKGGVKFGEGQNPHNGGRKKKTDLAKFLDEMRAGDGKLRFKPNQFKIEVDGSCVVDVPNDQILAYKLFTKALNDKGYLDILLKIGGDYSAMKFEHSGVDGEPLFPAYDLSKLTEDELRTFSELESKCRISPPETP